MLKKLVTVFVLLSMAFVSTCGIPSNNLPFPHYGVAYAQVRGGSSIEIIDVSYFAGNNTSEDRTEVTISGYSWNNCERIRIYYNDMRIKVFDPGSGDWTATFVVAAIPQECSVRVEGTMSGWSNYCYFDGAPAGVTFGLMQTKQKMGTVGATAGIVAVNWRPKGLVTIFFRGLPIDRLYPSPMWETKFTVPEAPAGVWPVEVRDESNSWKFDFQVVPNLVTEPADITPGQPMTIIGTGFAKNAYVHLTQVDKVVFTNTVGSFRLERVQSPSATDFVIEGLDEENNVAQLQITPKTPIADNPVVVSTPTTIQIPGPSLPSVDPGYVIAGLVGLIVLGLIVGLVIALRRHGR